MITMHKNSILNPDVVVEWIAEDKLTQQECLDKSVRGQALLGRVPWHEMPRAAKAVELWASAAGPMELVDQPKCE